MRRHALLATLPIALLLATAVVWLRPTIDLSAAGAPSVDAAPNCQRDVPMLVAPYFHGTELPAADAPMQATVSARIAAALSARLDALQPRNAPRDTPRTAVLGYTLTVPVLSLFEPATDGTWQFSARALQAYLDLIDQVDRPVVVYLMSDHFSKSSALTRSLLKDPRNLMAKPDGQPPVSIYFSDTIFPFTLSVNEDVPVNHLRFEGLRQIARALQALDQRHPGRIQAVTLGGEFHHLFDGLQNNTGKFSDITYTDHSALAQHEFRTWLQQRHASLEALNQAMGTRFAEWDQVRAPSGDIRTTPLEGFWQHMDANAGGKLAVYGWIDTAAGVDAIQVELDGRQIGRAQRGLNRLDVYQARADIRDPNTGFRYDLALQNLAPGVHRLRLVAQMRDGTQRLVAVRQIVRMASDQSRPPRSAPAQQATEPTLAPLDAQSFWLDSPREMQDAYFNPFAVEWQRFREEQVRRHIGKLFEIAAAEGLDPARLFSHQLLPYLNGGWNDTLFAAGRSFEDTPFQPGLTLYGGLTVSTLALRYTGGRPYGMPEMNPLLSKDAAEPLQALDFALTHCARFVSPSFMNLSDKNPTASDTFSLFLISPNSPHAHGRHFYAAIEQFVRR
ncbi:MAG TPA: beta-galactosidase [Pseudorhodoferax sp.]|nr:beta-galactosidase [Pseudorhodoferax sp.]